MHDFFFLWISRVCSLASSVATNCKINVLYKINGFVLFSLHCWAIPLVARNGGGEREGEGRDKSSLEGGRVHIIKPISYKSDVCYTWLFELPPYLD